MNRSVYRVGAAKMTQHLNVSKILLLFKDTFDELTDKITPSVNNVCISYSLFYLRCKFHINALNDCQDFANLLRGYFNLGHPVFQGHLSSSTLVPIESVSATSY